MNKRVILAAIGAPLLGLLVACSSGGSKNNTTSNNVVGTASTVAPSGASASTGSTGSTAPKATTASTGASANDNTAEVVTAITNLAQSKHWKAQINDPSDPSGSGTFEFVAPDKYHLTLPDTEVIAIGSDIYLKQSGTWTKLPSASSSGSFFDPNSFQDLTAGAKTAPATKGGTDTVNGTKCQIYTYVDTASTNKIDVCIADHLPLRVVQSDGESTSTTLFDFKSNIDIKAPI